MIVEARGESFVLSEESIQEIEQWLVKYPPEHRRSAVVAALMAAQQQNGGWLSTAAMRAVADYLKIPEIWVYEVVTFYDMFETKPVGKHKIGICTNLSCQLRGCNSIVEHLEKRLGVKLGETTQ